MLARWGDNYCAIHRAEPCIGPKGPLRESEPIPLIVSVAFLHRLLRRQASYFIIQGRAVVAQLVEQLIRNQ